MCKDDDRVRWEKSSGALQGKGTSNLVLFFLAKEKGHQITCKESNHVNFGDFAMGNEKAKINKKKRNKYEMGLMGRIHGLSLTSPSHVREEIFIHVWFGVENESIVFSLLFYLNA